MDEKEIQLINHVLSAKVTLREPTFLSIIHREYDEDLVSRYLAFILISNPSVILKMINAYEQWNGRHSEVAGKHLSIVDCRCEKVTIGQKRVDIFIKAKNELGINSIILIENKINAQEHDSQTSKYSTWGKELSGIPSSNVYCFYLFPENQPKEKPSSKDFYSITYKQLDDFLIGDNQFVTDFKKYIKQNLEETDMDERDKVVIDNFSAIDEAMQKIYRRRSSFFSTIEQKIYAKLPLLIAYPRQQDIRIEYYKKDWDLYINENHFYFFLGIMMEGGDPNKLVIWKGAKKYLHSGGDLLEKFLLSQNTKEFTEDNAPFFEAKKVSFQPKNPCSPLSFEWEKEADAFVVEAFKNYTKEQDTTIAEFQKWLSCQNVSQNNP